VAGHDPSTREEYDSRITPHDFVSRLIETLELRGTLVAQCIKDAAPPPPELKWSGEDAKEKALALLKLAHHHLDWANQPWHEGAHELFALRGAGLVYAVLVTATNQPAEPWRPSHIFALGVFGNVLRKLGLELNRIGKELEARLYRQVIKVAKSDAVLSDPEGAPEVQTLYELLDELTRFLED